MGVLAVDNFFSIQVFQLLSEQDYESGNFFDANSVKPLVSCVRDQLFYIADVLLWLCAVSSEH